MTDDHSSVEAVAKAIKAVWDAQMQREADTSNGLLDYEPGDWREWEEEARAAIAAMPARCDQDKLVGELVDGEADSLAHNLALRDRFIVERGLWSAFVDQFLPATRARQSGSAEQ